MSDAIAGFAGALFVQPNGGANQKVAEMKEWNLAIERDEIEVTNKDSGAWGEFLPGIRRVTGTANGNYTGAASQVALFTSLLADSGGAGGFYLTAQFKTSTTPGEDMYTCTLFVTKFEVGDPLDDAVSLDLEFRVTGAITKGVVV